MTDIAQVIREKAARLRELEAEAMRLRLELAEISKVVGEALPQAHGGRPVKRANKTRGKERPIKPGSNVFAAMEMLTTVGRPTHIDQMLPAVEKIVGKKISKATLVGQISEYVRRNEVFTRPEPSTFGLIAWENRNGNGNGNGNGHVKKEIN